MDFYKNYSIKEWLKMCIFNTYYQIVPPLCSVFSHQQSMHGLISSIYSAKYQQVLAVSRCHVNYWGWPNEWVGTMLFFKRGVPILLLLLPINAYFQSFIFHTWCENVVCYCSSNLHFFLYWWCWTFLHIHWSFFLFAICPFIH